MKLLSCCKNDLSYTHHVLTFSIPKLLIKRDFIDMVFPT
jgi:hypothetical protein